MYKCFSLLTAFAMLAVAPCPARADDYSAGMDAYSARKYKTAAKLLKPAAEAGNALAQYQMGVMYDAGQGVHRNELAAITWYRIAAESEPRAQVALADRLMEGRGIAHDQKAAIDWYRKAAAQADLTALLRLAIAYRDGTGVPKDPVLAHVFASIHVRAWGKMDLAERDKLSKELAAIMTVEQRAESEELQLQGMADLKRLPASSRSGQKQGQ
jgi:TPR repeat protein